MGVGGQHAGGQVQPEATAWITSIHATEDDFDPKGGGVVLDDLRVLTCYHIIKNLDQKWVAFPNGRGGAHLIRRQVDHVVLPDSGSYGHLSDSYRDVYDLAILVLAKPVPVGVAPAPLFFPEPEELIGTRWWALGFPSGPLGGPAVGDVDSALTYGWVRLRRTSHDWVQEGFSGGGLWSPDYRGVVGIVGQAERASGNGQAITLYQADQWFPDQHLSSLAKRQYAPGQADPSPYPPEVVELADFLASLPDPLAIIHKVLDRTPAVAPQGATVLQLLAWMHMLVQPREEPPLLRQVRVLAEQRMTEWTQASPLLVAASTDSPADADPCLLISISKDHFDEKNFLLSLTLFQDGQPGKPQPCGNASGSLPKIKELVRELLPPILDSRRDTPLIEFAVPEELLGEDFDQWPMQSRPDGRPDEDYRVGERYPVVVRDLARLDPGKVSIRDRDMWESRWQLLLTCEGPPSDLLREVELHEIAALRASAAFSWLRANLWDAAGNAVLVLLPPARALASGKSSRTGKAVNEALRAGFAVGMPGVIWLRQPGVRKAIGTRATVSAGTDQDEDDRTYIEKALGIEKAFGRDDPNQPAAQDTPGQPERAPNLRVRDLPLLVKSLRLQAEKDRRPASYQGRRLSLLWADPGRIWTPSTLQLPSRSSNGEDQ